MHRFALVLVSVVLLAPGLDAAVGLTHIHPFGLNVYAIDQEFVDTTGFDGGPGGRDYTGISFSSTPFAGPNVEALLATFQAFGATGSQPSHQFEFTGPFLDESVTTFAVRSGDEFSRTRILAGDFVELETFQTYYLPEEFFLGVLTPARGIDGEIGGDGWAFQPAFGWMRLRHAGGELTLVDHSMAYEAEGIIVGTPIAVPEPGNMGLLAVALAGLVWSRRRFRPLLHR